MSTTKEQAVGAKTGKPVEEKPPELEGPALLAWAKQTFMHVNAGAQIPPDDLLLGMVPALRAAMEEPPEPESPPVAPLDPMEAVLTAEDVPPWVKGLAAVSAAQTAKLTEAMLGLVEKQAAATGREIELKGSVDDLVNQLAGTVSEGPPPKDPLAVPVVFTARGAQFKAVRKPRHRSVMPNGDQVFTTGITYDFAPHGRFTTIDPSAVAWLEARPGFQVEYWRQDAPPHSAPDPALVIDRVLDLTLALDDGGLVKLLAEESASHKRKVVIDAINRARAKVQGYEGG